ncbi:MAG TPA: hypothetical protein VN426_17565 [Syntrophomonadaceae bacterium]|nr:hypothetical protein [Syntrophomonadaceae bacterium]
MDANNYGIPNTLPVNGQDRFEYIANYQIQAVVTFDQRLEADVLNKAVRLSLDAEPVLGCRFIEDDKEPCWQRFEGIDKMPWFKYVQTNDKQAAIGQFLKGPFAYAEQQVNVRFVRSQDSDTLCVKICHACADAAALKEYLDLLAGIYSKLQDDSDFEPVPNIHSRRDQKHYFDALGIQEPLALFNPNAPFLPPNWAFPHSGVERQDMHAAMRRFHNEAFDRIIAFGKNHKVTVTALILTAMYRSLFEMVKPPIEEEMGICVTTDLRKVFVGSPDQALCNLSVGIYPRIARIEGESFIDTLKRVSGAIEGLKKDRAELRDAIVLEAWGAMDYSQLLAIMQGVIQWAQESGKSDPLLSNVGVIQPLQFGPIVATDAYVITPTVYAPGFMLGICTYDRTLTLAASYAQPAQKTEEVEAFMDLMEKKLMSL